MMKNTMQIALSPALYQPEVLFDRLCARLGVKSFSALGSRTGLHPSVISKIRHRKVAISSEILLKIHEATEIPIRELRSWMGDTRPFYSPLSSAILCRPVVPVRSAARRDLTAKTAADRAPSGMLRAA